MKVPLHASLLLMAGLLAGGAAIHFLTGDKTWKPPAVQSLDMQSLEVPNIRLDSLLLPDLQVVAARPLFSQSRRPEEAAAQVPESPAAPEALDQLVVLGLFGSGPARGGIFRDQGKVVRLLSGERLGSWMLKRVDGSEVEFVGDDGRSHVLRVKHLPQPAAAPGAGLGAKQVPARALTTRRGDVDAPEESKASDAAPSINVQ